MALSLKDSRFRAGLPGATLLKDGSCLFVLWAPFCRSVALHCLKPKEMRLPMQRDAHGYWWVKASRVAPGTVYFYQLNGQRELPDPASRFQPEGVHGPSSVIDFKEPGFQKTAWSNPRLERYVLYELHIGTFTQQGTFAAAIKELGALKALGITAIEVMPIAQFPGARNWGYDGVYPFAVQNSYGGPLGFKRFVDACHDLGLAVVLDVVYNHFGPEGNYASQFGPYFFRRHKTPWGSGLNFDGLYNEGVRHFFISNALYWIRHFGVDGLRLDAVHAIRDFSRRPFLLDLTHAVHIEGRRLGRRIYLFPESALYNPRLTAVRGKGGFGFHAAWNDDLHRSLHALLTGERRGYYGAFGKLAHLGAALKKGRPLSFVVYAQNHDQVGNRADGKRLKSLVSFEQLKLAAGVLLLAPYIPLLFMGEEYGETRRFFYFVSFEGKALIRAVWRGRRQELKNFWARAASCRRSASGAPGAASYASCPEPQSRSAFLLSKLNRRQKPRRPRKILRSFYQELIRLRRSLLEAAHFSEKGFDVDWSEKKRWLILTWNPQLELDSTQNLGILPSQKSSTVPPARSHFFVSSKYPSFESRSNAPTGDSRLRHIDGRAGVFIVFNFNRQVQELCALMPEGRWSVIFDSADSRWLPLPSRKKRGGGEAMAGYSFRVFERNF